MAPLTRALARRIRRISLAACLAALILSDPQLATAQPAGGSGLEVFASAGAGPMWDDESLLGTGWAIGGGIGYRFPGNVGVELLIDRRDHDRRFSSGVRFTARGSRVTGRLAYYGRGPRVRWYAGGALGTMEIERRSEFPDECGFDAAGMYRCAGTLVFERTVRERVLAGMTGVRIALNERMFLRPEFELSVAGEFVTMGGAVSVGWGW